MTAPSAVAADTTTAIVAGVAAAAVIVGLLWVALSFAAVRDARRRTESVIFVLFAGVLTLVLPFFGYLVYMIVRPPTTLDEERQLLLEEQALTEPPPAETSRPCPSCGREIEADFVICPYCRTQFARRCRSCQRWLRLGWRICPYCAEEVGLQSVGQSRAASS